MLYGDHLYHRHAMCAVLCGWVYTWYNIRSTLRGISSPPVLIICVLYNIPGVKCVGFDGYLCMNMIVVRHDASRCFTRHAGMRRRHSEARIQMATRSIVLGLAIVIMIGIVCLNTRLQLSATCEMVPRHGGSLNKTQNPKTAGRLSYAEKTLHSTRATTGGSRLGPCFAAPQNHSATHGGVISSSSWSTTEKNLVCFTA